MADVKYNKSVHSRIIRKASQVSGWKQVDIILLESSYNDVDVTYVLFKHNKLPFEARYSKNTFGKEKCVITNVEVDEFDEDEDFGRMG